ncbi:MAG TPA: tetratricopeptide repeat protein [Desulfuromonadaceae bacterium]
MEHSGLPVSACALLVESAFQHHSSGNASEAERLYRQALDVDPENFDALHLLGLLAHQVGRNDIAVELIEKALQHATSPAALNNLGQAYRGLARPEEAARCYREAIALKPDYVTAYNNLGSVLQESGKAAEAEGVYRQALAIRPDVVELYCNLANALQDMGRFEEAEQACRQALTIYPGLAAAHNILGKALQNLGRLEEAEHAFRHTLSIQPGYAMAHNNLGTVLHALGRLAEAEQACRRALEINPDLAMACNNLGAVLRTLSRLEESEQALRRALALTPDHAGTLDNLAVTLKELGRLEEAKNTSLRSLALNPNSTQAHSNLGVINMEMGLSEEAAVAFRQALAIRPDNGEARWNLGLLHLQHGDFAAGWSGYEWRLSTQKDPHGQLGMPRYNGADLKGATIFVYGEQGVGEELMFSSCLDDVCMQAGHCILECDSRLVPLFARSFPAISVVGATGRDEAALPAGLPHADFKLALGSLPLYCRNSWSAFKERGPWLIPDQDALCTWRSRYDALGDGLKVGIAWRGGIRTELNRMRSASLGQWRDVFAIPGIHFINLQYGDCAREIRELQEQGGPCIHSWDDVDQLRDLDDFAAQVAGLDLVISIDNTTVHMAGALGRPVWCLLSRVPNWRWMLDRRDSPWYPTMRLFRQTRPHDWADVFRAVAAELSLLL